eukprot:g1673.t1
MTFNYDKWNNLSFSDSDSDSDVSKAAKSKQSKPVKITSSSFLLENVKQLRGKGNALFEQGQLSDACEIYLGAIEGARHCREGISSSAAAYSEAMSIEVACHLNIAAIGVTSGNWRAALKHADAALLIDKENARAFYIRGGAKHEIGGTENLISAKLDLESSLQIAPGSQDVRNKLDQVQQELIKLGKIDHSLNKTKSVKNRNKKSKNKIEETSKKMLKAKPKNDSLQKMSKAADTASRNGNFHGSIKMLHSLLSAIKDRQTTNNIEKYSNADAEAATRTRLGLDLLAINDAEAAVDQFVEALKKKRTANGLKLNLDNSSTTSTSGPTIEILEDGEEVEDEKKVDCKHCAILLSHLGRALVAQARSTSKMKTSLFVRAAEHYEECAAVAQFLADQKENNFAKPLQARALLQAGHCRKRLISEKMVDNFLAIKKEEKEKLEKNENRQYADENFTFAAKVAFDIGDVRTAAEALEGVASVQISAKAMHLALQKAADALEKLEKRATENEKDKTNKKAKESIAIIKKKRLELLVRAARIASKAIPPDPAAEAMYAKALLLARQEKFRVIEGCCLMGMASALARHGNYKESLKMMRKGLVVSRQLDDLANETQCLLELSRMLRKNGPEYYDEAAKVARQGLQNMMRLAEKEDGASKTFQEMKAGLLMALSEALAVSATSKHNEREDAADIEQIDASDGRIIEALNLLRQAESIFDKLGLVIQRAGALQAIGTLSKDTAELLRAIEILNRAGEMGTSAIALRGLGMLQRSKGLLDDAENTFMKVASICRKAVDAELCEDRWRSSEANPGEEEARALLSVAEIRMQRTEGKNEMPALEALEGALAALHNRAKQSISSFRLLSKIETFQKALINSHQNREKDKDI